MPQHTRVVLFGLALLLSVVGAVGCGSSGGDDGPRACRDLCANACDCVSIASSVVNLPSAAQPADTPGSPGVRVELFSPLSIQFGGTAIDLNRARFTRYAIDADLDPEAILIVVPGFEGGASDFAILAGELLPRLLHEEDLVAEVWAFDRRTDQLEDREGLILAAQLDAPDVGLDWLFGEELGLELSPELNRRAILYNSQDDIPFLANWTPLVFSQDIDAVVEAALVTVGNGNVFLGGHSAGTGFAARYASTDFDLDGTGEAQPGYAKLRGLVLFEGGGGSTRSDGISDEVLDRIEARFDGGLYEAVRSGVDSCTDGTPCSLASELEDCGHLPNPRCTNSVGAFAEIPGLLNPRVLAAIEPAAIQGQSDPDEGRIILQVEQGGQEGNTAIAAVEDLGGLNFLGQGTVMGGIGEFVDDDNFVAGFAPFVAMSVGFRGPRDSMGVQSWLDITEELPAQAFRDNGPAPETIPGEAWGIEVEPTSFDKLLDLFIGETNFLDWYYASSGLSVTNGLPSLDSSALSLDPPLGRGRRDIENLTQAAQIDLPVICFGGSNGLTTVPGDFVAFAESIAPCGLPSCDGTPRVIDAATPSRAFPTLGGIEGGFEAYISEGYSHVDIVTAEDGPGNEVIGPLIGFLSRNSVR